MFDKMRNNSRIIVYIVIAVFVISGGFMGFGAYMNRSGSGGNSPSQALAEVNGNNISQQEFLSVLRNQAQQASQLSSTQLLSFKYNILSSIIERRLILKEAENMGIEVNITTKEVDDTMDKVLEQNKMTREELKSNLEEQNYSIDQLRSDLRNNLKTQQIIQKTVEKSYSNVKVSENEIKKEYDKQYQGKEDKPSFADKKEEIKKNLLQQKQNQAYNNWMKNLKAKAKIEIHDPALRGIKEMQNNDYAKASSSFEKALEVNKTPTNYIYLAQSYNENNKSDKALDTYNKAVENFADNWEIRLNYAQLYNDIEKNDLAKEQYTKASELAGEGDFMAHYQIYQGFKGIGAEEKAKAEMDKIIQIQQNMSQSNQKNDLDEKAKPKVDVDPVPEKKTSN